MTCETIGLQPRTVTSLAPQLEAQ